MTTASELGRRRRGPFGIPWVVLLLLAPCLLLYMALFVVPQMRLLGTGFVVNGDPGLAHYARMFEDGYYLFLMGRTLLCGLGVTLITVMLGVPLAYWLARLPSRWAGFILMLTTFPMLISAVVRSFGWMVLFFRNGPVSQLLVASGLSDSPVQLMYTLTGVTIGLAQVLLPLMVLTLYGVFRSIDPALESAAMTLGARPVVTFFLVTLPLARAGIVAGSLLVFALTISAFATPSLVGGARANMMATAIYENAVDLLDWPFASALASVLLVVVLGISAVYAVLADRGRHDQPVRG
jgi:putative spermidine/putrescine transport system permease protein